MKFIKIIVVATLIIFSVYGCSSNQPGLSDNLQKTFQKVIPISDMNSSLHVKVISDGKGENKFGSDINVIIENTSDQQIFLPATTPTIFRIFIINNNDWVEIKNDDSYFGGDATLDPKGQLMSKWITWVRPVLTTDIKNDGKQETVRIVTIGELMSNGKKTGITVGAYVDLVMEP